MRHFDRILNYVTLSLVVAVAILWGIFDAWVPSEADLPRVLGFLLGLVAAAILHTWTRYSDLCREAEKLALEVRETSNTSKRLADTMAHQIVQMSFADAFAHAYKFAPNVNRLRIYAITTQIISSQMPSLPFRVKTCEVLLYGPPPDIKTEMLATRIDVAIKDWQAVKRRGQIEKLRIGQYPNLPTQYLVIYDDRIALWGLYYRAEHDYTGIHSSDPFVITGDHLGTRPLIAELTNWFDNAMSTAKEIDVTDLTAQTARKETDVEGNSTR